MPFSSPARFVSLCGLLLATGGFGAIASAAPNAEDDPRAVRRAFLPEFRAQIKADPSVAPRVLSNFWQSHSNQKAAVLIENSIEAARILWRTDRSQTDAALNLLDLTIQHFSNTRARYLAVEAKSDILRRSGRLDEAGKLLQTAWPEVQSGDVNPVMTPILSEWVEVLREQKQPDKAIELMYGALQTTPPLVNWMNFYRLMVDSQLDAGHNDEALRWAALYYRVVPFKDDDIARATSLVAQVWLKDAQQMGNPALFAAAQSAATAPNPLQKVELPQLPPAVRAALQARVKSDADKEAVSSQMSLFIVLGEPRAAMLEAREILLRNPTGIAGTSEVARVFKAVDGDVVRANEFLAFYRTGKGQNPLTEFLTGVEPREVMP